MHGTLPGFSLYYYHVFQYEVCIVPHEFIYISIHIQVGVHPWVFSLFFLFPFFLIKNIIYAYMNTYKKTLSFITIFLLEIKPTFKVD